MLRWPPVRRVVPKPMLWGELLPALRLGTRSSTVGYEFIDQDDGARARANTVHVCVDRHGMHSRPLPAPFRACLKAYL